MHKSYKIAILPGDGIGPEIMAEAYKVLEVVKKKYSIHLQLEKYDIGGIAIDLYNSPLPKHTLHGCSQADAILMGAVGGPKWANLPADRRPESGALLVLRKSFDLFVNLRPIQLSPFLQNFSPLRSDLSQHGIDILCIRELIGGIYFGLPKGRNHIDNDNISAFDTEIYTTKEIENIAHIAFQLSMQRKNRLISVDKSNVLESSILWREVVTMVGKHYPAVQLTHMYVDTVAMKLIQSPYLFDVLLCSNLFGDILSDECAALIGSLGLLPSASINKQHFGLYEPAGGSAPDIAGKNIANPIAQILSVAMLFRYSLQLPHIAIDIERAVEQTLQQGYRTKDIAFDSSHYVTTDIMGTAITTILSETSSV